MGKWCVAVASEDPNIFPQFACFSVAKRVGYEKARVHAASADGREPICFMKRAGKFRCIQGEVTTAADAVEARKGLSARFCTYCYELLRAGVRGSIWKAGFKLDD